jgi:hypothetical protein
MSISSSPWNEKRGARAALACAGALALALAGCMSSDAEELPACPYSEAPTTGAHRLYLDFDGEALTPGGDDATLGRSSLVPQGVTVPPFSAEPADVAAIVRSVRATLAPFDVDVVTTRPADGVYDMIVFGGRSDRVLGTADVVQFAGPSECDAWPESQVAFVFDVRKPAEAFASTAVGLYAVMHGAATTARPGDCLCLGDSACGASPLRCKLGRRVLGSEASACGAAATIDSGQQMADAFSCRE